MSVSYNPAMFTKGARAAFIEAKVASKSRLIEKGVATYINSESYDEDYGWIGEGSNFEEFKDEVNFVPTSDGEYTLANKLYTSGLSVSRSNIADEKVGGLALRIRERGAKYGGFVDYLITQAIIAGTTSGAGTVAAGAHFRTDHPVRGSESAVGNNLYTGTGTSIAQIQTDVSGAVAKLMTIEGEDGHPVNIGAMSFFVMCPWGTLFQTRDALKGSMLSQTSNVRFDDIDFDIFGNPYLDATSATDYYVGIRNTPIGGFVFQDRETMTLESQDNAESDAAFEREEYRYKTRFRGRAGYGRWSKVQKINNS